MRKEWIDEAKPKDHYANDSSSKAQASAVHETGPSVPDNSSDPVRPTARSMTPMANNLDDEELYSATPRKVLDKRREEPDANQDESLFVSDVENDVSPSGDELDALLAEEDERERTNASDIQVPHYPPVQSKVTEPDFDDEMEALADIERME